MEQDSFIDLLDSVYETADNKHEIDLWAPLSNMILQATELRISKGLNQEQLSKIMNTRQSAISRFENFGRKPTYEFLAKIAQALNQSIGLTLFGDYMAVVPESKRDFIRKEASQRGVSIKELTQTLLETALDNIEEQKYWASQPMTFQVSMHNAYQGNELKEKDLIECQQIPACY